MLRQLSRWEYDPEALCPMWNERLELVQPDAEVRAVLPRMYGQTLTGLTDVSAGRMQLNSGGSLADDYIDLLQKKEIAWWTMRYGADMKTPSASVVVL